MFTLEDYYEWLVSSHHTKCHSVSVTVFELTKSTCGGRTPKGNVVDTDWIRAFEAGFHSSESAPTSTMCGSPLVTYPLNFLVLLNVW